MKEETGLNLTKKIYFSTKMNITGSKKISKTKEKEGGSLVNSKMFERGKG